MTDRAATDPDFVRAFAALPGAFVILTRSLTIVGASDAYLAVTMTDRATILGRALFDVFPENPTRPDEGFGATLRASVERVFAHAKAERLPVLKYDIPRPETQGGGFEERFWSPANTPVLDGDGKVAWVIHAVEDVTEVERLKPEEREHLAIRALARRSDERYSKLLDTAPDAMVVVDESGRILLVNLRTEQLFGYARAELVGQPLDLLIPQRLREGHGVHLARYFASPGPRPMGSGRELFGRRKDGGELPIEVSLSPLRTEEGLTVSAAIRDISERKRMEAEANLTAARLASAVDSIQDAFALFDDEDRLVLCNSVYRRLIGDSLPGPFVGTSYERLLDAWISDIAFATDAEREAFRTTRLSHRKTEQTTSFDLRMRDGRSLRVIDRRTAEGGIVKTIWDLTSDVRLAEELREARAAAEAASSAKSEFLSSMSHELRTPLNAVLGFAQLLQRDRKEPLSARHADRVAQILRGGEHLLRLIDDILDLSHIEAGRVSISTEPVGVPEVLAEVASSVEALAARQGIRVEVEPLPPQLPMVYVDRTRFAQILMNFASNAIKYNRPAGSVTFIVSLLGDDRLRVTVVDTGMGIPGEKQDKLFQPFQRAGQETGPIEGTGIGLVITKRLAELMKGEVGFHSVSGEGSRFWVDIPVHNSTAAARTPPSVREPMGSQGRGEGRRLVLYVEDNPANVAFMKDLVLSFDGIDLISAPTAELGVELSLARAPDAIVMDINLPGMSGLDALRILKESPATRAIPVIALTAAASDRDKLRGTQAGFFRYLTKPVKVDEFVAALDRALAPRT